MSTLEDWAWFIQHNVASVDQINIGIIAPQSGPAPLAGTTSDRTSNVVLQHSLGPLLDQFADLVAVAGTPLN